MRNKKIIMLLVSVLAIVLILTGCEKKSNKSYIFDVETGDKIEIKMDTTCGYNLTSKLPIEFSKDDEVISQGTFAQEYAYDEYYKLVKNGSDATIIEEKNNGNIEYFFYEYDDSEYNYIIKIKNSKTCFILGNNKSKKSAQEIFERLEFEVK